MALKFLSHKRFHPRKLCNIKAVAQAERKVKQETTRMIELRREMAEEKDLENLRNLQIASGRIPNVSSRLEWMYKPPPIPQKEEEPEEPPLEHVFPSDLPRDSILNNPIPPKLQTGEFPGIKWANSDTPSKLDRDIKIREDPRTAILNNRAQKQAEQKKRIEFLKRMEEERNLKAPTSYQFTLNEAHKMIPNMPDLSRYGSSFIDYSPSYSESNSSSYKQESTRLSYSRESHGHHERKYH